MTCLQNNNSAFSVNMMDNIPKVLNFYWQSFNNHAMCVYLPKTVCFRIQGFLKNCKTGSERNFADKNRLYSKRVQSIQRALLLVFMNKNYKIQILAQVWIHKFAEKGLAKSELQNKFKIIPWATNFFCPTFSFMWKGGIAVQLLSFIIILNTKLKFSKSEGNKNRYFHR